MRVSTKITEASEYFGADIEATKSGFALRKWLSGPDYRYKGD